MNSMFAGYLVSYGILFIYSIYLIIYLMLTISPGYKMSKKEETIAIYMGVFIICLHLVFLILYVKSEL